MDRYVYQLILHPDALVASGAEQGRIIRGCHADRKSGRYHTQRANPDFAAG